ncbi:MAG: peptidyl-prolyl cis-trans isomerase [Candidatus Latescibacteria bacterium]|nr:peptidyl-prolyl cis-trans isomerase [Candidatus Latescibacterota bacterium]
MFIATTRSLWRSLALLALFGCAPDDPVVAQVGDVALTKAEYLRFVERLPPGLQSESARDHLQSLVDQELLLQEARARGIEQSDEVRYQLNALVRKQLSQRYQAEVLAPQVEVTPEEVERTFSDMGFDRERLFARILVRQQQDVDRVLQALHEGEPFAELAQRFAANDLFAPQGDGVVGWIGRTQAQRFAIPPQTFLSLPVGQVAEPLRLAGGWQIYRFVEDRAADKADYAEEAARAAHREKWESRLQIEVETLSRSLSLQLDHEGLQTLLAEPNLADSLAALPLYHFDGGAISLGECLYDLRSAGFRAALQDSAQVVSLARTMFLPAYLLAAAAQQRGWDREADFVEWRERKRKALVLQQLTKAETATKAVPSEEEVAAYYEANKTRFRTAESVHINQLLAPTREQAQKLRQALANGSTVAELLARPDVETHGDPHDGALHLRKVVRSRYPQLVDAAFAAEVGEWGGPVEVLDQFGVFRVLHKEGGDIQPFAQARAQARAILAARLQNELMDALIQRLRAERESQVALFAERL